MRAFSGAHHEHSQSDRSAHEDDRRVSSQPGKHVGRGAWAKGGLRTLAAESAGQVGRSALLQENHKDQKQRILTICTATTKTRRIFILKAAFQVSPADPDERDLVRKRGLEPLCLVGASTSSWCVCQFRHLRTRGELYEYSKSRGWKEQLPVAQLRNASVVSQFEILSPCAGSGSAAYWIHGKTTARPESTR